MGMNAPYIPTKDAQLILWLDNFAALISAGPAAFGLSAGDAATIAGDVATYDAAYAPVTSPSTKTAAAVAAKNAAKTVVLTQVRPYAQSISLNPGVTSDNKIALGLNPRTSGPSPITAPASNPILSVVSASVLSMILRYKDSSTGVSGKAKPYGVVGCEVHGMFSVTPISDPSSLPVMLTATKSPVSVNFPGGSSGQRWFFSARWVTRKQLYSPFSPVVSYIVP